MPVCAGRLSDKKFVHKVARILRQLLGKELAQPTAGAVGRASSAAGRASGSAGRARTAADAESDEEEFDSVCLPGAGGGRRAGPALSDSDSDAEGNNDRDGDSESDDAIEADGGAGPAPEEDDEFQAIPSTNDLDLTGASLTCAPASRAPCYS